MPSKGKKKGLKGQTELESENDFLEAADDMETAMSKWRIGDPDKALRFFDRALQIYSRGLQQYPGDFDLAYNKANLQYTAADTFSVQLGSSKTIALLRDAVSSHEFALSLEVDADALFNAAQSLSRLGQELYDNESGQPPRLTMEPFNFGVEAIKLLEKCLESQEKEFEELQDIREDMAEPSDMEEPIAETTPQWATVHKPVTVTDLLDTSLALLGVISDLIKYTPLSIPDKQTAMAKVEELANMGNLVMQKKLREYLHLISKQQALPRIPSDSVKVLSLTSGTVRTEDVNGQEDVVATSLYQVEEQVALFHSSIATTQFRLGALPIQQYALRLQEIFESPPISNYTSSLPGYAQELEQFSDIITENQDESQAVIIVYRLEALEKADAVLAKAIDAASSGSLNSDFSQTDLNEDRAEVALHRRFIGMLPDASPTMLETGARLLSAAKEFLKDAIECAKREFKSNRELELKIKLKVVENMATGVSIMLPAVMSAFRRDDVQRIVDAMYEDELIPRAMN
jgi:tetratricopeptide (TPR) repeat protein